MGTEILSRKPNPLTSPPGAPHAGLAPPMGVQRTLCPSLFLTALVACSDEPLGQVGQSCGNDDACASGLMCIDGFCRAENPDAGMPDAGPPPDAGMPDAGPLPNGEELTFGVVQTLPDGTARGLRLVGSAFMTRGTDDRTSVRIKVAGLAANTEYPAHVHDQRCEQNAGGAHYKIDPTIADTIEANEIWPAVSAGAQGVGYGDRTVLHRARPEAQSIVVHDPGDGARLACVNLEPEPMVRLSGPFQALPDGALLNLTGTAEITRRNGAGTELSVTLSGTLDASTIYPAHLHDAPCDQNAGGGHYKIDPTVIDTVEANELWPTVMTVAAGGMGEGTFTSASHITRADGWSVVVHEPGTGNRLACADLR